IFSSNSLRVPNISNLRSQPLPAPGERFAAAFHHTAHFSAQLALLQRAALLHAALPASELHDMDQLSIAVDHDIRVVSHNEELAAELIFTNLPDDQVIDQMVVKIVLGLIQHNRLFAEG